MDSSEQRIQKHLVIKSAGHKRKVLNKPTESGPRESRLSSGIMILIAVMAISVAAVVVYLVINRSANQAAVRNTNSEANQTNSHQDQPRPIVQQQAQQPPVVIQQPASGQQAPGIIQPSSERDSAGDDANMQKVAIKRLAEETEMSAVLIKIIDARAVLSGTVNSAATRARAERLVKAVRGVKSVDNQIVVSG